MSCESTRLDVQVGAFPQGWKGNVQELADQLASLLIVTFPEDISTFVVGNSEPPTNRGPWLNTSFEPPQWYVWSDVQGRYVPVGIPQESLGYIISQNPPDPTKFDLWFQVDSSNKLLNIYTHDGTDWVTCVVNEERLRVTQDGIGGLNDDGTYVVKSGTNILDDNESLNEDILDLDQGVKDANNRLDSFAENPATQAIAEGNPSGKAVTYVIGKPQNSTWGTIEIHGHAMGQSNGGFKYVSSTATGGIDFEVSSLIKGTQYSNVILDDGGQEANHFNPHHIALTLVDPTIDVVTITITYAGNGSVPNVNRGIILGTYNIIPPS